MASIYTRFIIILYMNKELNKDINWDKIITFKDIPDIQNFHFWRVNSMTIQELLFDIVQLEDKKSLRVFCSLFWTKRVLYKMIEFYIMFTMEPFRTRFMRMRNYLIFLNKLETLDDDKIINKELFISNQDKFCWELTDEYKIPIQYKPIHLFV